jgi:hypothetical protein
MASAFRAATERLNTVAVPRLPAWEPMRSDEALNLSGKRKAMFALPQPHAACD